MKEPERRADPPERESPPAFDSLVSPAELVRGERTRDDFFDAVLGLSSPATVREIAERAGHGTDAAREYLEWFERLGIVTQTSESPATYARNREYLQWRRVQDLRTQYSTSELVSLLDTEVEREADLAASFDADRPDAVSISARASSTGTSVEEVWETLSAWRTSRRRIALLERALRTDTGNAADAHPTV